jgi:hypothetical protein
VLALAALKADVSAHSHYLPLITAAGMRLLEPDYVAKFYLYYHFR